VFELVTPPKYMLETVASQSLKGCGSHHDSQAWGKAEGMLEQCLLLSGRNKW